MLLLSLQEEGGWSWGPFHKLRLRKKRGYPATWFYGFAAASNLIGRLMWTATITVHVGHTGPLPQVRAAPISSPISFPRACPGC